MKLFAIFMHAKVFVKTLRSSYTQTAEHHECVSELPKHGLR